MITHPVQPIKLVSLQVSFTVAVECILTRDENKDVDWDTFLFERYYMTQLKWDFDSDFDWKAGRGRKAATRRPRQSAHRTTDSRDHGDHGICVDAQTISRKTIRVP
jgi:hypothetical protein